MLDKMVRFKVEYDDENNRSSCADRALIKKAVWLFDLPPKTWTH